MEQHFGDWQGHAIADLARGAPDAWAAFWADPGHARPPGGESFADVVARVGAALDRLAETARGRDLVAVTHGGAVRAALAHALDLAPARALAFVVDTWSLTRLDAIPGGDADMPRQWRIGGVNLRPNGAFE
jgi:alpha-ribazole phosphatase